MERLASWPVYFRYRIGPAPMARGASSRASTVRGQRKRLIERRPFGHHPVARGAFSTAKWSRSDLRLRFRSDLSELQSTHVAHVSRPTVCASPLAFHPAGR